MTKLFQITQLQLSEYLTRKSTLEGCKPKKKAGGDDEEPCGMEYLFNQREEASLENGIGHVYVYGTLLFDPSPCELEMGNTGYDDIEDDIEEMLELGAKGIVLHINSGGGEVMGNTEVAEYIQNLQVPVVASVAGFSCSAAYKIMAGCSYIVATKSSVVGNIGTIMVFLDTSTYDKAMGLKYIPFVNDGAIYKSIGHTDTLTQEQIAYLQNDINRCGANFQQFVLSNRNVSPEVFTSAWYSDVESIAVGLVDEIGNEELATQRCQELITMFNPEPMLIQLLNE